MDLHAAFDAFDMFHVPKPRHVFDIGNMGLKIVRQPANPADCIGLEKIFRVKKDEHKFIVSKGGLEFIHDFQGPVPFYKPDFVGIIENKALHLIGKKSGQRNDKKNCLPAEADNFASQKIKKPVPASVVMSDRFK